VLRSTDPEETLVAAANFAASGHRGVFLLETPAAVAANQRFLDEFKPDHVFVAATAVEVRQHLFPQPSRVIVGPADDRRLLLAAAARAVAARCPLDASTPGERPPGGGTA